MCGNMGLFRDNGKWKLLFRVQGLGYPFGGPHNKDSSILGSKLGSPSFGQLAYVPFREASPHKLDCCMHSP